MKSASLRGLRRLSVALVLLVLGIYTFPYLATTTVLSSKRVPFSFAPDLPFYLNLSKIGSSQLNPYFGTTIHPEFGYLTFNTAPRLLGLTAELAGNDLWWTVFIWNALWWVALCVAATWLLRMMFPDLPGLLLYLAVAFLFFFNFGLMRALFQGWAHLPSLSGFGSLGLPYIRTMFPQVPIALLLVYLLLQLRALQSWNWWPWAGMWAVQAMAFAMFPYATLLMAISTAVAAVAEMVSQARLDRWKIVGLFGLTCAIADLAWLALRLPKGPNRSHPALISPDVSRFGDLVGGALLLLILLTVVAVASRPVGTRATKWTLVGLGTATTCLMLGDLMFSPALLVSHHGGYFMHSTASLLLVYVVAALERVGARFGWMRKAYIALAILVTMNGFVLAYNGYRYSLSDNRRINDLALAVDSQPLTADDLIVARAESTDDLCAWAPLLTPAKVLFCRSAQFVLSQQERLDAYRQRQAFYLYFVGKNAQEIAGIFTDARKSAEQNRLGLVAESISVNRHAGNSVFTHLIPMLSEVEEGNPHMRDVLAPYKKVLIIDEMDNPVFVQKRLSNYLLIERQQHVGRFDLLWCRPRIAGGN